jgi:hypothetical protein
VRTMSKRWLVRLGAVALVASGSAVVAATPAQAFIPATVSMTLAAGQTGSLTKSCGSPGLPENVVNGGALVTTPFVRVFQSYPSSDSAWTVSATNTSGSSQTVSIRVDCEAPLQSYLRQPTAVFPVSGDVGDARASCGTGRTAMSGGWKFDNANFGLITSRASADNQWQVRAKNFNGSTARMDAYVVCVGNIGLARHYEPRTGFLADTVPAGGLANWQGHCPNGWWTTGAGVNVTDFSGFLLVTGDLPTVNFSTTFDEWKFNFKNFDTTAHTIQHNLICYGN